MGEVTVDFIAREADNVAWRMVLVEQGPWTITDVTSQLRRIQDRLYSCIDAALEGALAKQYPESALKPLVIQLDGYDLPEKDVRSFFEAFSNQVLELPDYKRALAKNDYVRQISFALNLARLKDGG